MVAERAPMLAPIRQGTPAWEEARRSTIGSSDIAVIVGESPHKSSYTLAAEKLGLIPEVIDDETRELMDIGTLMQPVLLQLYERHTGRHPKGAPTWRLHPEIEWASASLDGTAPTRRVVEAKWTHSKRWRAGDKVPGDVFVQVQWQLFVIGWEVADVVVLDHTQARIEEIERDDATIDNLLYFAREFRGYLERGELPPIDGSESTRKALAAKYPGDSEPWIPATAELVDLTSALAHARTEKKRAEDTERSVANALRVVMGEAGGIEGLVSFKKNRDGERTNWPAVAGAYRELIDRVFDDADRGDIATVPFRLSDTYEPVTRELVDAIQSTHTDRVEGARVLRLLSAKGAIE